MIVDFDNKGSEARGATPAFWAKAIVSSAASVSCALILFLTLMESNHRSKQRYVAPRIKKPVYARASIQIPVKSLNVISEVPEPLESMRPLYDWPEENLAPLREELSSILKLRRSRASRAVKAARTCDVSWLNRLITQGVDVLSVDGNGETALGWAVRSNCQSVLGRLLSVGAEASAREANGLSAIDWAFRERNIAVINMFRVNARG